MATMVPFLCRPPHAINSDLDELSLTKSATGTPKNLKTNLQSAKSG